MAGQEEDFTSRWAKKPFPLNVQTQYGESDAPSARLETQLSWGSQSGQDETAVGTGASHDHLAELSLGSEHAPRRTSSLPSAINSQWGAAGRPPAWDEAFKVGGMWGKIPLGRELMSAPSRQASGLTDPSSPASSLPPLASPRVKEAKQTLPITHSAGMHSMQRLPKLSLRSQPEDEEEQTADLASMLQLSATPRESEKGDSADQWTSYTMMTLHRHHSAPSGYIERVFGAGRGMSSLGMPGAAHRRAGQGQAPGTGVGGLGPFPTNSMSEEASPTESSALQPPRSLRGGEQLSLSLLRQAQESPPQLSLLQDELAQGHRGSDGHVADSTAYRERMPHESLQLAAPSSQLARGEGLGGQAESRRAGGSDPTIDFSDQLGSLGGGEGLRLRKRPPGLDLREEPSELRERKKARSPASGDSPQERVAESRQTSATEGLPSEGRRGGQQDSRPSGGDTSPMKVDYGELSPGNAVLCKARAKRGCATHPRSIAERVRRTRISENMRKLQELVPHVDKQANTADMLEEAVEYMKFLITKVEEYDNGKDLGKEFAALRAEVSSPRQRQGGAPASSEAESSDM